MQFPRDPGAFLQHGPPRPLGLGALGLGGQRALGAQPGADAVHRDRHRGEDDGGAGRAVQVRHVRRQPQPPRDEGQRPHPPQRRPLLADTGQAERPQQGEYLPRAPRPAAPPGGGYQRGQQQRQPPDPPGQHRVPGRQRQRRHHRHGQQQLPQRRDPGQVGDAERERRHRRARRRRPGAPAASAIATRTAGRGRSAPGPARATPARPRRAPPPGRRRLGQRDAGHPFHDPQGRPPGPPGSSRQRCHTQVSVRPPGRPGLPAWYDRGSGSPV